MLPISGHILYLRRSCRLRMTHYLSYTAIIVLLISCYKQTHSIIAVFPICLRTTNRITHGFFHLRFLQRTFVLLTWWDICYAFISLLILFFYSMEETNSCNIFPVRLFVTLSFVGHYERSWWISRRMLR